MQRHQFRGREVLEIVSFASKGGWRTAEAGSMNGQRSRLGATTDCQVPPEQSLERTFTQNSVATGFGLAPPLRTQMTHCVASREADIRHTLTLAKSLDGAHRVTNSVKTLSLYEREHAPHIGIQR